MRYRMMFAAAAMAALVTTGVTASMGPAQASIPVPAEGNLTVLPTGPRVVPSPGTVMAAGQTQTFTIAGKTFSGTAIPADTTGVVLSVTATNPTAAGHLTAWTTEAGKPGSPTVSYVAGKAATNVAFVGLNSEGKLNVFASTKTNFVMSILSYVTPLDEPAAPVLKSIEASEKVLEQVGGSIRGSLPSLKGATDFGSVTLTKGTWDARVIGGFTGLNDINKACTTDDNFLTGSMVLVKGDGSVADPATRLFDFDQVAGTAGGVIVPESNSATLTQDPTVQVDTFITVDADTKVTVRLFGYASNSSTDCTGVLEANLQSAQFLKVA